MIANDKTFYLSVVDKRYSSNGFPHKSKVNKSKFFNIVLDLNKIHFMDKTALCYVLLHSFNILFIYLRLFNNQ